MFFFILFYFYLYILFFIFFFFFFKQKTAYEIDMSLEFRRVLFRSTAGRVIARVHILRRVVINGVNERIEFLRVHHVALVISALARRVDAIRKQDDRLASLNP